MYFVFSLNALILVYLGAYIFRRDKSALARVFLAISVAFAVWILCVLLLQLKPDLVSPNWVTRIQNQASLVFFNGFYYFSRLYPQPGKSRRVDYNLFPFAFLSCLILFTNQVTEVSLEGGSLVYRDGWGWTFYTVYVVSLVLLSTVKLLLSAQRHPDYRKRIRLLLVGIVGFVAVTMIFNTILPAFGVQDYIALGYISICFPPYFIAYAITKQELLDVDFLINRKSAWSLTLLFVVMSFAATIYYTRDLFMLHSGSIVCLGAFWAFYAKRLQEFLLTTAKRKFVRSWYDTEEVMTLISEKITAEKNREEIFKIIHRALDDVFEFEFSHLLVATRGDDETLSNYHLLEAASGKALERISPASGLVEDFKSWTGPLYLEEARGSIRDFLSRLGYKKGKKCIIITFNSPEFLEGIIVLGERSNGNPYSEVDKRFFARLVNYMSGIFYRLTPFEKLELIYFENKQKLHEAEIQLIRAQKIESIVHATRQCHHEIRTPLNIIRLGIGRIKSLKDLEAYRTVAREEISRALEIVEETLTITDVTKASPDRYARMDVNEVLGRCAKLVDQSRFNLVLELGGVSPIWGSFSDIQVAITNLIHNAMDAMGEEGTLSIRSEQSGESISIEVEDSGKGIPEHLRSRVWEPYFSGQETAAGNSTAGRGWGLTIVNRIVTEHKGTINFTSETGVGTRFTIVLPVLADSGSGRADKKVVPFNPRKAG